MDTVDSKILGQLLLAQYVVESLPADQTLAEYLQSMFSSMPIIERCDCFLNGVLYPSPIKNSNSDGTTTKYTLQTRNLALGWIELKTTEVEMLTPYNPHLITFFNFVAMVMENRQQRQSLELINKQLEQTVQQRTQQLKASDERWQFALEGSRDGIWEWAIENDDFFFSSRWYEMHNLTADHVYDFASLLQRVHADDQSELLAQRDQILNGKATFIDCEYRLMDGNNRYQWVSDRGQVSEINSLNNPTRITGTHRDISLNKRTDEQLRVGAIVYDSISEGIVVLDSDRNITAINSAVTKFTGYSEKNLIGQPSSIIFNRLNGDNSAEQIRHSLQEKGQWKGEVWFHRPGKKPRPNLLSVNQIISRCGEVVEGYVGVFSDISELKRTEAKLYKIAHHDPLTNLPNRLMLNLRLIEALEKAKKSGQTLAVFFLDIDRFKNINDSMGHHVGDQLLMQVANRLRGALECENSIARLGGDEFVLLAEDIQNERQVELIAEHILGVFKKTFTLGKQQIFISTSIGISLYPDDSGSPESLIKHADTAMYMAKASGRNTYHRYRSELTTAVYEKLQLEIDLKHAIGNDELALYYQPQVNLESGEVVCTEALLRWHHPSLGAINPDRFIPVAEESGVMQSLGSWVLLEACRQMKQWQDENLLSIKMSVNLSVTQFQHQDFCLEVERILEQTGADPHSLVLEITESVLMKQTQHTRNVISGLRQLGIEISIDDFGKGFSSLSYLTQIDSSRLKIDRSFIENIELGEKDATIAATIIQIGKNLHQIVVAEGVETKEQVNFLKLHGCTQAQGYFYGGPVNATDFRQHLKTVPEKIATPDFSSKRRATTRL